MGPRNRHWRSRLRRFASQWPVLAGPVWLACCLGCVYCLGCPGVVLADDDARHEGDRPARLRVGAPRHHEGRVYLDCELTGMISGEVLDALQSGLPATVIFEWQLWWDRDGWWDKRVDTGATFYRIYYDVLQTRYDVFDHRGRLLLSAETPAAVEACFRQQPGLELREFPPVLADRLYYIDLVARIEPLDEEEIRDLEDWLRGDEDGRNSLDLVSTLSNQVFGWLKGVVVPGGTSVRARTAAFQGWE